MKLCRGAIAAFILGSLGLMPGAHAALFGPTPYLSFADSPFSGGSFSYFHLETFEDHLLNTPGVTANAGFVTGTGFGGTVIDSVFGDGNCPQNSAPNPCDSYFGSGGIVLSFTFNPVVLGALPDSVGIVWTDGGNPVTFQAFDASNALIGTIGPVAIADGSNFGTTAEDRFFGISGVGGISRITIGNTGATEVDHLQYGLQQEPPPVDGRVPEPATLLLLLTAGLASVGLRRRQKR